jgi:maltooligosyltrehalose trehalohydrolase
VRPSESFLALFTEDEPTVATAAAAAALAALAAPSVAPSAASSFREDGGSAGLSTGTRTGTGSGSGSGSGAAVPSLLGSPGFGAGAGAGAPGSAARRPRSAAAAGLGSGVAAGGLAAPRLPLSLSGASTGDLTPAAPATAADGGDDDTPGAGAPAEGKKKTGWLRGVRSRKGLLGDSNDD